MEEKKREDGLVAMAACYQRFDPAAYLQYNYTPPRADFERKDSIVPWKLACLHRAFNEGKAMGVNFIHAFLFPYKIYGGSKHCSNAKYLCFFFVFKKKIYT